MSHDQQLLFQVKTFPLRWFTVLIDGQEVDCLRIILIHPSHPIDRSDCICCLAHILNSKKCNMLRDEISLSVYSS